MTTQSTESTTLIGGADLQETTVIWNIKNFPSIVTDDQWIARQYFEFEAGSKSSRTFSKWQVYLVPGVEESGGKWIGIYIKLVEHFKRIAATEEDGHNEQDEDVGSSVRAECSFTLKGKGGSQGGKSSANGNQRCNNCGTNFSGSQRCPRCYPASTVPDMTKKTDLFAVYDFKNGRGIREMIDRSNGSNIFNSYLDEDGSLIIHCTLKLLLVTGKPAAVMKAKLSLEQFEEISTKTIPSDLAGLLSNNIPCTDVKIVTSDGEEFIAQRGILAARSKYFANMFQSKMKEELSGVVKLNISGKTFQVLRQFIYTGTLSESDWNEDDVIVELLNAAAEYDIADLLHFLDGIVGDICNHKTVVQLLQLAHKLSLTKAEEDLLEWIKENGMHSAEAFFRMMDFVVDPK